MKKPKKKVVAAPRNESSPTEIKPVESVPPGGFTIKEFAAAFNVHRRTVDRWLAKNRLIVSRTPGGMPRIHGIEPFPKTREQILAFYGGQS